MSANTYGSPSNTASKGPANIFSWIELFGVKGFISNLIILLPALFYCGDHSSLNLSIGLVLFCLLTSAISCLNALGDVLSDLGHPKRKNKALPSGNVSERTAQIAVMVLLLVLCRLSFFLSFCHYWPFHFLSFTLLSILFIQLVREMIQEWMAC